MIWTANTERYCDVKEGLNTTAKELMTSITMDKEEVSPSTIFAVASILEGVRAKARYGTSILQCVTKIQLVSTWQCTKSAKRDGL